jgi:hypothetical protein
MRTARWGVMTHYLADWRARTDNLTMSIEQWNKLADDFDVESWLTNSSRGRGIPHPDDRPELRLLRGA